jgi:hypothetical protein
MITTICHNVSETIKNQKTCHEKGLAIKSLQIKKLK